jgi:ubiquinone biosynthesis monooxygenase Coq7
MRRLTPMDQFITQVDNTLRTLFGPPQVTERVNPANDLPDAEMRDSERKLAAGLMRVNHAGEIAAQGLYQGQALTARLPQVRDSMQRAALEEYDHLDWCEVRLKELNSHTSYLKPFWYAGSFAIGAAAGVAGDKWSLGFVAETERQVVRHIDSHMQRLPAHDVKSRAILAQMRIDEKRHATNAIKAGGAPLPKPVKLAMRQVAKVMTGTAFWV